MDHPNLTEIRRARNELDAVTREIRQVPGFEQFLAPPTFDDIGEAAREHPLAYVAASTLGGLVLVVRGHEVVHLPMASLTAEVVHTRVERHRQAYLAFRADRDRGGRVWPAALDAWATALDDTTRWLWDEIMGALVEEVSPAAAIVLVSGGLLGLLPLHAAWTEDPGASDGRRYALDSLAISYVPNARSLTAARRLAERPARRLLAVTDPSPEPLQFAGVEVDLVAQAFDHSVILGPATATVTNVKNALQDADVAHFACHGVANLVNPLDSGLVLAGGTRLRLRDLLELKSHLRLAVLSACETSLPGTDLPDEVVSLPSGLLQAGVGGVVASLWEVSDRPTTTLMVRFYWLWLRECLTPPAALQQAQQWMRRTTNEEKLAFLEETVEVGMFGEEAIDALCGDLMREEDPRSDSGLSTWAAFTYVGA